MPPFVPISDRFNNFVKKSGPRECWLWQGSLDVRGYGQLRGPKKTTLKAHRVSYQLHKGAIPRGLFVLHSCDNPACVNPAHLKAGTHLDNMKEARARGRTPRGEHSGHAKLTAAKVFAIRSDTRRQYEIAADYGIIQQTVSDIKRRKRWAHI